MLRYTKLVAILAMLAMLCGLALGCGPSSAPASPTAADPTAAPAASEKADEPAEEQPAESSAMIIGDIDLSEKEVALKTWLLGDTPVDQDRVYGEVNKILKEKVNTTLDINYIPWSDAGTKYQLLFASGEEFDQCYTAFWTTPAFQVLAAKNAFMELTEDMFKTYAPNAYELVPEAAWKQNYVNGKIYTFPKSGRAFDYKTVVMIRGDLREKYGLAEPNTREKYTDYLLAIAENEEGIVPYQVEEAGGMLQSVYYQQYHNVYTFTPAYIQYDLANPDNEITLMLDDPRFLEFCMMMKDFRDKGVIPSDAASKPVSSSSGEAFIAGKSATFAWNVNILNAYNTVMDEHPEWKPEVYDLSPDGLTFPTPYRDGVAISPTSKNWERCLIVQEQLRTDKELWDMSNYGIAGVHWEPVGEDKYRILPDAKNFVANGSCQWGWQTDFQRVSETYPQSYIDMEANWRAREVPYYMNGFALDVTNVKNIEAVLQNLTTQYYRPLTLGAFDDPAKAIAEYKQKQMEAGLEEFFAECKIQAAAYIERMK